MLQLQACLGEVRECNCAPHSLPKKGSSDPLEFHSPQPQSSTLSLPLFYKDSFSGPGPLERIDDGEGGHLAVGGSHSAPSPPPLPVCLHTPYPFRFHYSSWHTDKGGNSIPWHSGSSQSSSCESHRATQGGFRSSTDAGCRSCEGCWGSIP